LAPKKSMNIRELELFSHLAATLHYGKTSHECNITPSGLTRAIQRLEGEVGTPLFQRNNRSVSLTPAGVRFREYCQESISRWQLFRTQLHSDTALRGELSLYCSVTAVVSILPRIFKRFRQAHPEVLIRVQTGDAAKALQKLQTREVDIAIAALPDRQPEGLAFLELLQTPLLFISPRAFPGIIAVNGSRPDWSKTPVIMPSEGLSRIRAEKWFADKGIRPYIYSQVSGNEAIIAMVAMGCGIGIVPRLVLEQSSLHDEVDILAVSPQLEAFVVAACTIARNLRNPVIQSFWATVATEINSHPQSP
jgi:LysR family positive regulator for ilvC